MALKVNDRRKTHMLIEEALAFESESKNFEYEEIPTRSIQKMRFGHVGVIDTARAVLDSSVVSEITVPEHLDMRLMYQHLSS
jgi:hypothetical protein